jgi:hypothetical protein
VLAKPFEPQLVIARVRELLGKEAPAAPVAVAAAGNPRPPAPVSDLWAPAPAQAEPLDNYFEQLDAAFATLGGAPAEPVKTASAQLTSAESLDWLNTASDAPLDLTPPIRLTPDPTADVPLWKPDPPADVPLSKPDPAAQLTPSIRLKPDPTADVTLWHPNPTADGPLSIRQKPDLTLPTGKPARQAEPAPPPAPVAPPMAASEVQSRPGALPPLADAFAAILAAEQHEPMPGWPAPALPTPQAASANGGASLGEDAIEEITRRVLDRLSDRIGRETVAALVSDIAERLVREEIEHIKSTIK